MKIVLFGATGMVGQGVLRECLLAADVESVLAVGRTAIGQTNPKLRDIVHLNLMDISPIAAELAACDACFFCLGVSSVGMKEVDYTRITYDLTLSVARELAKLNPKLTFIYVSGQNTDSSEKGRSMWARVKGKTENALLALPFQAFMFRPGFIQPMHGIKSKTFLYRAIYSATAVLTPLLKRLAPGSITDNEKLGRAMLVVARQGSTRKIFETADINKTADAQKTP